MPKVAVLGAGISGLAFAHRLSELRGGWEIVLFEAGSRAGGTIETEKRDGFVLEKGPDSIISEKPWALELAKRIGLESQIIGTENENRRSLILRKNKLIEVPKGFYLIAPTDAGEFFRSPLFSPLGKLRILMEPLVPAKKDDADESVASFIRRRFGRECLERVGQPMLAGIYTGDPEQLSIKATMPRFAEIEKKHKSLILGLRGKEPQSSGPRYSLFLTFRDGMEVLVKALVARLPEGTLRLNSPVRSAHYDVQDKKWRIDFPDRNSEFFDLVVSALPAHRAAPIFEEECASLASLLGQIPYESVATLNFAFKKDKVSHPLNAFGFVVPKTENNILVAASFMSKKYSHRAPSSHVLLRAFVGGAFGHSYLDLTDTEIYERTLRALSQALGIEGRPELWSLKRYPSSMVQYAVGHQERLERIMKEAAACPGLRLIGAGFRGVGIPDCVREAEKAAEEIALC